MLIRKAAIACLNRILHGGVKADIALERSSLGIAGRDRGLLHELVYGVLRWHYSLEADFSRFNQSRPDEISQAALLVGTYQLRHMRVPAHAAVSETVAAMHQLNAKAAGYINAILRRVAASDAPKKLKPNQRAELPKWMYARWRDAFGADTVHASCAALKQTPPLCVAVLTDRDAWMEEVQQRGIDAKIGALSPWAVLLPAGNDVTALPGFDDGAFTVMDQAAQAAVLALKPANSAGVVMDICAAPGGKTALLAHCFPQAHIVAVELHARRMPRLQENLCRMQCTNVSVVQADAGQLPVPDAAVDAVLLDAPCSASGIFRRHPDAKFLHNAADVASLAGIQTGLLRESMRVLKPGACMTYAVCSIHPEENERILAGYEVTAMQRLFPDPAHDGFFQANVLKYMPDDA